MSESFKKPVLKRTLSDLSATSLVTTPSGMLRGLIKRKKAETFLTSLEVKPARKYSLDSEDNNSVMVHSTGSKKPVNTIMEPLGLPSHARRPDLRCPPPRLSSSSESPRATNKSRFENYCEEKFSLASPFPPRYPFECPLGSPASSSSSVFIQLVDTAPSSLLSVDFSRNSLYIPKSKPPPTPKSSLDNWGDFTHFFNNTTNNTNFTTRFAPRRMFNRVTPKIKKLLNHIKKSSSSYGG